MAKVEATKEQEENVFRAIEIAKSTGKVSKGTNEVTKAIEKGNAKLVAVAKDVSPPEIVMHIPLLADEKETLCIEVSSKEELGAAAGLHVGTASVAITQEGEAKQILKELLTELKKE